MQNDNYVHFDFIINLRDNNDPEAWNRIMDAFIRAVVEEDAGATGGMHPLGANYKTCEACRDARKDSKTLGRFRFNPFTWL